ncbi:MAG: hypothetical protein IJ219_02035 [Bacteroidaceae bacterium]|nr:hypothetical protein [Bacteroidaceae bacterium]MBQ9171215.1 hypothetical protein [Bacteroidaceae bacterium]MBQ9293694.1 hypothetical protein [Bacteroidaceae bacterium]
MKSKLLLLLLILVGTSSKCFSEDIQKALQVLNRGVNVRAEASASSAKIASNPEYLLVVDEDEEWYHAYILMNANGEESGEILPQLGYVSKKVCKVREPKAINSAYIQNAIKHASITASVRESGKYKGLCAFSFNSSYAADDREYLFLGILYDNYVWGVSIAFVCDYGEKRIRSFGDDGERLNVPFARIYPDNSDTYVWNALTDDEINKILSITAANEYLLPGKVRFSFRDGDGETGDSFVIYSSPLQEQNESTVDENSEETTAEPTPSFEHEKFTIKPFKFDKFIQVTKNGVNIRKQPNTQSPRLMKLYDQTEECMECPAEHKWMTRQLKPNEGENASYEGLELPLTGESGDWYQVYIGDISSYMLDDYGYISKQFCRVTHREPMQLPVERMDDISGFAIYMVESGKYKGLCISVEKDEFYGQTLRLGVYYDGMCVFPYSIPYWDSEKIYIENNNLNVKPGMLSKSNLTTSSALLDYLVSNLSHMSSEFTTIYYGDSESPSSIMMPTSKIFK